MTPCAVITGGAGGLGLACARDLGQRGPVLVVDRSVDGLAAAAAALAADGIEAHTVVCDVVDRDATAAVVRRVEALGGLGPLIHAAGVWNADAPGQTIFDVNYGGTVNVLDAFEPLVAPGVVAVCIASIGGHRRVSAERLDRVLGAEHGSSAWAAVRRDGFDVDDPVVAYAVAKRGVMVECERRSPSWAARGGRILSISPGNFDTPMGRLGRDTGAANHAVDTTIGRRAGRPDELARIVGFVTSADAGYITGIDLRIDGGAVAALRHDPAWADVFTRWEGKLQAPEPR